jgi:hypothetical protein
MLGSLDTYSPYAAVLLIGLCSLLPMTLENKKQAKFWLRVAVVAACAVFLVYVFMVGRYVISIETPANGVQTRSVGFSS